jgi:dTDP-4-amino-4,6-dideoxy-D-galactose acyltransferase
MNVEKVEWDSDFFGYNVGKINVNNGINFNIDLLNFKDYTLIYLFSKIKLENLDSILVDEKVVLNLNLIDQNIEKDNNIVSEFKHFSKFPQLLDLAFQSGIYSRFKKDENFINNEFERLYIKWITNSVVDKKSVVVFIYELDGKILGFVTVDKKTDIQASIGLIAVELNSRGQGIGIKLLNQVKRYLVNNGFQKLSLVTQGDNIPALKLYQKAGFYIEESSFTYHIWNTK